MTGLIGREGVIGIHHVNFTVENLDRTVEFYTNLLGFELRSRAEYHGDAGVAETLLGDLHKEETRDGVHAEIAALELTGLRVEFMQWLAPKSLSYHRDASIAGSAHLGIRVKDVATVRDRLKQAGVVFRSPADHAFEEVGHRPWRWCAFSDPDGIIVELIQEQPITDLIRRLGLRLREARMARGLTLKQAAEMSEISVAHLSQVERGDAIPSLPALVGISATLGVAPEYFLRPDVEGWQGALTNGRSPGAWRESSSAKRSTRVLTADNRQVLAVTGGVKWQWLTDQDAATRVVRTYYDPGAVSEDLGFGRAGTETGVVLEGTLTVEVGSETYVLEAGASITYDRSAGRRFRNDGTVPAVALWVIAETS